MTTSNINLWVVLFCLGTQTICGRIEPPKHDANLTFYVPGLKPRPNDANLVITWSRNPQSRLRSDPGKPK